MLGYNTGKHRVLFIFLCNIDTDLTGMNMTKLILFIVSGFFLSGAAGQDPGRIKFGEISAADFAPQVYAIDSSASAVVIADIGSSRIEGNNKNWFSLAYKRYRRIRILNKNGYDLANVSIPLYSNGDDEENLTKLRAATYNLENGNVVTTRLDEKSGVFREKISKNSVRKKFTLPNVKEGCIIEYEYTIVSDFLFNLRAWEFQGTIPRLWSEYNVSIPEFLGYLTFSQGYLKFDINKTEERRDSYSVAEGRSAGPSGRFNFTANVTDRRWVIRDVPALKEERYTSTLDNHISKIEFQLVEYRPPLEYRRIIDSWEKVSEDLMNASYFGQQVRDNGWMKEIISPLKEGARSKLETAKKIFAWVRDNFTCTDHGRFTMDQTLKNLVKTRTGNVAEINLLLTALLRTAGIESDPVILSTRSNGFTYSLYPILSQYNYTVTRAQVEGLTCYLDASEPHLGFNFLPLPCYNGHARVMNTAAEAVELVADSLTETKYTSVFIVNDEKGNWVGSLQQTPGYYESMDLRDKVREKGRDNLQKEIQKNFGADIVMQNFQIDSLDQYEEKLGIRYDFDLKGEKEDILYLNPMFGEQYRENPFKSAERRYPVEMPYAMDETYNLQLEVPQGYRVDELPKSIVVKLNEENEGLFEYRISVSGDNLSFRSRIRIARAYFAPEEYEMLREFFNLVVKKQAEQVVFKKKK